MRRPRRVPGPEHGTGVAQGARPDTVEPDKVESAAVRPPTCRESPVKIAVRPLAALLIVAGLSVNAAQAVPQADGAPLVDPASNAGHAPEAAVAVDTDQEALKRFDVLYALSANHPNERHRLYGQKAAATGHWVDAAKAFRMAARYADKYSQHRLSLAYWYGVGVRADRVEAYLWADLAAERGYPQFLAIREKMWRELAADEQADVARRGPALYAEYGDPVAKARFERALGQGRSQVTGSRTGFVGFLGVRSGASLRGGLVNLNDELELARFHSPSRNDPGKYWAQEDRVWKHVTVRVGEIEEVVPAADAPQP